jgi:proteasome lid subunit RPN8/RPN11
LSSVSIWKPVFDRIVQASHETENEIIGFLLGRLENNTLVIDDSITGEFSSEPHRVALLPSALAQIADKLISGRVKGNIVGWYHSHTEGGVFFSQTDIETQEALQQFSSLVTGIVVDANTGEVGYFRIDPQTKKPFRMREEMVSVRTEPFEASPLDPTPRAPTRATPTIEVRQEQQLLAPKPPEIRPQPRKRTSTLVIAVVLIILVASVGLVSGLLLYSGALSASGLSIIHNPVLTGTIGTPVEISANITGTAQNVTLYFASPGESLTPIQMTLVQGDLYRCKIPGEQVTGNLAYYIVATDRAGSKKQTSQYQILISDFALSSGTSALKIYRTQRTSGELDLLPINGFSQQVSLSATGAPLGLTISFNPNPVPTGLTKVTMNFAASQTTPNGTFQVVVKGSYNPPGSQPVTRQLTIPVTITDFDLQVLPSQVQVSAGTSTTITLLVTLQRGFADPVTVTVNGLPQGATYKLTTSGNTVGGPGTITMTLQITTTKSVKSGSYTLTINASGGGITHSQPVQFIVR